MPSQSLTGGQAAAYISDFAGGKRLFCAFLAFAHR
jgi:hypothetical protein